MREQSFKRFVDRSAHEERLRRGGEALARIDELREHILRRTGIQPDSDPLIRETREERARRFD